jgi:membrane-associated protein
MESIGQFFEILMNSEKLIHYGGLVLLMVVIFAETGLFFGFLFPGDALLFTAGLLCGTKDLDVPLLSLVAAVALSAILGNITGYMTGKLLGKKLFAKKDSLFFKQRHLAKTQAYYDKYGGTALIGGRFLPVIRTFVPIFAGAIDMNFWRFNGYNLMGAFLWAGTLIPLGFFVGNRFPASLDHIEYIVLGITVITMTILIRGMIRFKKRSGMPEKEE